jgi:class 3 adenylate cyclase
MSSSEPKSRLMVLMFTDIVGSVRLKNRLGTPEYARLLALHDRALRRALGSVTGAEFLQDTGDGCLARFRTASDAVNAALRFQYDLHRLSASVGSAGRLAPASLLRVRIGIHLGETTEMTDSDSGRGKIVGVAVDMASRIMALGQGGQILVTRAAYDDARQYVRKHPHCDGSEPQRIEWRCHGLYALAGNEDAMEVFEIGGVGVAPFELPPDGEKGYRVSGRAETAGYRGWLERSRNALRDPRVRAVVVLAAAGATWVTGWLLADRHFQPLSLEEASIESLALPASVRRDASERILRLVARSAPELTDPDRLQSYPAWSSYLVDLAEVAGAPELRKAGGDADIAKLAPWVAGYGTPASALDSPENNGEVAPGAGPVFVQAFLAIQGLEAREFVGWKVQAALLPLLAGYGGTEVPRALTAVLGDLPNPERDALVPLGVEAAAAILDDRSLEIWFEETFRMSLKQFQERQRR